MFGHEGGKAMRRILELGEQKPHEKEPPNAWVFRVLSLDPKRYTGQELQTANGRMYYGTPGTDFTKYHPILNVSRETVQAIESWIQFGNEPDDHARAVSIVICNEDRTGFLLQRKDLKHPTEACQGRYSLFGGSPHIGEDVLRAAWRELLEEIPYLELGKHLYLVNHVDDLTLDSVQWPGTYVCSVFVLSLPDDVFNRLVRFSAFKGDVSESIASVMAVYEFCHILYPQEIALPGRHFVASHHLAINRILCDLTSSP